VFIITEMFVFNSNEIIEINTNLTTLSFSYFDEDQCMMRLVDSDSRECIDESGVNLIVFLVFCV